MKRLLLRAPLTLKQPHRAQCRSTLPFLGLSSFSSIVVNDTKGSSKSTRQQFRELPFDPAVVDHIRRIGVGIPSRSRKQKRATATSRSGSHIPWDLATRSHKEGATSALVGANKVSTTTLPPPFGPKSRVRVIAACTESAHFPHNPNETPEVAIAGRSNVGKSTLLNALLYLNKNETRPGLSKGEKAAVSSRPGETREITFYQLSSSSDISVGHGHERSGPVPKLRLVDLPGYGFAFASADQAASFQSLMKEYILHRGKVLKRVLMLIDGRHGMKQSDLEFLNALQQEDGVLPPIQVVLTKSDLVTQEDLARRVLLVRQQLSDCLRREPSQLPVMLVSARTSLMSPNKGGLLELQKELAAMVPDR